MTATVNEIEVTDLADLDFPLTCSECDTEASWALVSVCCGYNEPQCTTCKNEFMKILAEMIVYYHSMICVDCKRETFGKLPSDYVVVEPL